MFWVSGIAIFIYVVIFAAVTIAWAEIFIKAGYSRWLCFLMFIPVVNLIMFFWFAYSKWPIHEFVSRDWRKKLLEEKKAKLEREISLLTDDSTNKETCKKLEQTKTKTEEQSNGQKATGLMGSGEKIVVFFIVAVLIIAIIIIMFRAC